jgi:hypothetical protein
VGVWVDRPTASWTTSALASTRHAEGTEDVALGDDGVAAEVEVEGLGRAQALIDIAKNATTERWTDPFIVAPA